jgi:hypothetical protein
MSLRINFYFLFRDFHAFIFSFKNLPLYNMRTTVKQARNMQSKLMGKLVEDVTLAELTEGKAGVYHPLTADQKLRLVNGGGYIRYGFGLLPTEGFALEDRDVTLLLSDRLLLSMSKVGNDGRELRHQCVCNAHGRGTHAHLMSCVHTHEARKRVHDLVHKAFEDVLSQAKLSLNSKPWVDRKVTAPAPTGRHKMHVQTDTQFQLVNNNTFHQIDYTGSKYRSAGCSEAHSEEPGRGRQDKCLEECVVPALLKAETKKVNWYANYVIDKLFPVSFSWGGWLGPKGMDLVKVLAMRLQDARTLAPGVAHQWIGRKLGFAFIQGRLRLLNHVHPSINRMFTTNEL